MANWSSTGGKQSAADFLGSLIQIKAAGITLLHRFSAFWRKAMTPSEVTILIMIIGAFIAFAATLAWYSR